MNNKIKRYYRLKKNTKNDETGLKLCQLKNILASYRYVSFDIFDTLLKRDVQFPTDVFDIVERDYNCLHEYKNIQGFKEERIVAEKNARKNSHSEEVNLNTIYQNILSYSKSEKEELRALEKKIEYEICTPHLPMVEMYKYCIEQGKKVYLTSDMYLDETLIQNMLIKCGIYEYNTLYLSSTYGKTKKTGNLFECLLEQEAIKAEDLIHIGDSIYSDMKVPGEKGIKTFLIPRNIVYDTRCMPKWNNTLNNNILLSFINNRINYNEDNFYKFGYDSFGVLLWGFSKWLLKEMQAKHISKVYFFSRDGWIMKKAFDLVNSSNSNISSYYLEVSRRSLKVPLLWKQCTLNNVVQNLSAISIIKITSLFAGMGLDIRKYDKLIKKFGFDNNTYFERSDILENKEVNQLFEMVKEDVYINSKLEYESISKYLYQQKVFGNIAVVDIGWSGGMQRNLIEILRNMDAKAEVTGYYMGITRHYKRQMQKNKMNMKGYIFDYAHDAVPVEKHRGFVGLFETFFLEQKGSVMKYEYNMETNNVKVIRYPYEYIVNNEPNSEIKKIEKLQEGALDFIKCVEKSDYLKNMRISSSDSFENIMRYCGQPTSVELEMFANFHFYDEDNVSYLAKPKMSLIRYFFHIRQLRTDLYFSGWKIGFLRKLFKFNFPFYQMKQIKDMRLNKR